MRVKLFNEEEKEEARNILLNEYGADPNIDDYHGIGVDYYL